MSDLLCYMGIYIIVAIINPIEVDDEVILVMIDLDFLGLTISVSESVAL